MSHGDNVHYFARIIYAVDDSIITHSYPPQILFTNKLTTTCRAGLSCESLNLWKHSFDY